MERGVKRTSCGESDGKDTKIQKSVAGDIAKGVPTGQENVTELTTEMTLATEGVRKKLRSQVARYAGLPTEIWLIIAAFAFSDLATECKLACVSRFFRRIQPKGVGERLTKKTAALAIAKFMVRWAENCPSVGPLGDKSLFVASLERSDEKYLVTIAKEQTELPDPSALDIRTRDIVGDGEECFIMVEESAIETLLWLIYRHLDRKIFFGTSPEETGASPEGHELLEWFFNNMNSGFNVLSLLHVASDIKFLDALEIFCPHTEGVDTLTKVRDYDEGVAVLMDQAYFGYVGLPFDIHDERLSYPLNPFQ